MNKPLLIVITGPTASGKSALAVSLAQKLGTEIVSADSRQIYKGIPIVTAVPSNEERGGVTHHLMECLDLDQYYSAANFREDATNILKDIFIRQDVAIVCGGSMLYTDTLTKGIDDLPTVPSGFRSDLMRQWDLNGNDWLIEVLRQKDPVYFYKADLKNLKRVFHAVEISLLAGVPYTSLLTGKDNKQDLPYRLIKICLNGEREALFERINRRVIKMMEAGLEDEARSVYHLRHLNSLNTVGLKEMFAWFDGILTKDEAIARIQKNTRVYAKKQITWHKRDNELVYLNFEDSISYNTDKILSLKIIS